MMDTWLYFPLISIIAENEFYLETIFVVRYQFQKTDHLICFIISSFFSIPKMARDNRCIEQEISIRRAYWCLMSLMSLISCTNSNSARIYARWYRRLEFPEDVYTEVSILSPVETVFLALLLSAIYPAYSPWSLGRSRSARLLRILKSARYSLARVSVWCKTETRGCVK